MDGFEGQDYGTENVTEIWKKYENGLNYQRYINLLGRAELCHRMYNGNQWEGLETGGERLPMFNFIKPVVKYKVATISQNSMVAAYTPVKTSPEYSQACELLNLYFARLWELGKLDSLTWRMAKDAAVVGDSYLFFGLGTDAAAGQLIDNTNVFLADEQSAELQEQKYIIIRERLLVDEVRKQAEENGLTPDEIDLIQPDDDTENQIGNKKEVEGVRKCTSILYMTKVDGIVHFSRSVRNVVYQPDRAVQGEASEAEPYKRPTGLRSYPIINFVWEDVKGTARGVGEVEGLVPNQLEVNKTLARRSICIKMMAYPKMAYAAGQVRNPDDLDRVGALIEVANGGASKVSDMVSYLNPTVVSPDAKNLVEEIIYQTRELSGAGDAAAGSIDPTQASGAAIIAVRDQAALPLNEQIARLAQTVEDLARVWFDLWVAYNPNGLEVEDETTGEVGIIPPEVLDGMGVNIRVDVSKANPYSKFAQEQSLQNLLTGGMITFEEYVGALDTDAAMPKGKLEDILERRAAQAQMQQQTQLDQMAAGVQQLQAENAQLKEADAAKNQEMAKLARALQDNTNILGGG